MILLWNEPLFIIISNFVPPNHLQFHLCYLDLPTHVILPYFFVRSISLFSFISPPTLLLLFSHQYSLCFLFSFFNHPRNRLLQTRYTLKKRLPVLFCKSLVFVCVLLLGVLLALNNANKYYINANIVIKHNIRLS